jgi:hypothetical protein
MTQLLIKYGNIALTTTTIHRVWYHLYLLFLVRLGGYIANLSDFYSYRIIGKLTAFLQPQEFSFRNTTVDCSTSTVRHTLLRSSQNVEIYSLRLASKSHTHPSPWGVSVHTLLSSCQNVEIYSQRLTSKSHIHPSLNMSCFPKVLLVCHGFYYD